MRIIVCDEVLALAVRKLYNLWPRFFAFAGRRAASTQIKRKMPRMIKVAMCERTDKSSAIASTGPSSPQVP